MVLSSIGLDNGSLLLLLLLLPLGCISTSAALPSAGAAAPSAAAAAAPSRPKFADGENLKEDFGVKAFKALDFGVCIN